MSDAPDIESEVRELIQTVLGIARSSSTQLLRPDTGEWDSLKHMEIVFALEDRYGVTFDEVEFPALNSPEAIAAILKRHLAA